MLIFLCGSLWRFLLLNYEYFQLAYVSNAGEIKPESGACSKVACFYPMNTGEGPSGLKDDSFEEKWGRGISTSSKRQKFEVLGHLQSNLKNTPREKAVDTKIVCKSNFESTLLCDLSDP